MQGIIGFLILIVFNMLGVWLHNLLGIPLPGNVLGLILFLLALWTKTIRLEWVEKSAQFLLDHMLLFFIPYVVGIIAFFPLIGEHWFSMLTGTLGSTLAVLFVTGYVAKKTQKEAVNSSVQPSNLSSEKEGAAI